MKTFGPEASADPYAGHHEERAPDLVPPVEPPDPEAMSRTRARLDRLVKPPGSLGVLEELAVRLAGIAGESPPPVPDKKALIVFAGDHGVVAQGVSAYPAWVTARMVSVFMQGGAAISVLARYLSAQLWVADVGVGSVPGHAEGASPEEVPALTPKLFSPPADVRHDCPGPAAGAAASPGCATFVNARIRPGTRDFTREPAMTRDEAARALLAGRELLRRAASAGARLIGVGEMGIGNTTAASALIAALTGSDPARVVGPGTGLDPAGVQRKVEVVREALKRHQPGPHDPLGALAAVGGLEIAALAGALLEAASLRIPAVLDGFVVGAAAVVAAALSPQAPAYWLAGHRSAEPGHRLALAHLGLRPLLELDMRLGEATGAALAFPIVEAAVRLCREMWTLEQAGVTPP